MSNSRIPESDLKPANLLLTAQGRLLLTDFGSAAPLFSGSSVAFKHARTLVGTPDYLAPEVLRLAERVVEDSLAGEDDGERRAYGSEVDAWSLGVLTYEVSSIVVDLRVVTHEGRSCCMDKHHSLQIVSQRRTSGSS